MTEEGLSEPQLSGGPDGAIGFDVGATAPEIQSPLVEQQRTETEKLTSLLATSEAGDSDYKIIPIGAAGFLIKLGERPAVSGNDWVLFDLDDTVIAYSAAKTARLKAYESYLQSTGLSLNPSLAERLIDATDRFSRWQEGDAAMYHLDAHKAALAWATSALRVVPQEKVAETIGDIEVQLDAIKSGQNGQVNHDQKAPFYFENNKLVIPAPESTQEDIDAVFTTMITPQRYDDTLDVMIEVAGNANTPEQSVNIGIFTFGEPQFQLPKILEVIKAQAAIGRPLPLSHIWLTKVPKGEFVEELERTVGSEQAADYDPVIQEELFSPIPHTLLLVDDNPKELDAYVQQKPMFRNTHTALGVVRSIRKDTKTETHQWDRIIDPLNHEVGVGQFNAERPAEENLSAIVYAYLLNNLSNLIKHSTAEALDTNPDIKKRLNDRNEYYYEKARSSNQPLYRVSLP